MMVMLYAKHGLAALNGMIDRYTSDVNRAVKVQKKLHTTK